MVAETLPVARMTMIATIPPVYWKTRDFFSSLIQGRSISIYPARYALFPRVENIAR